MAATWQTYLVVALGGALGSVLRFATSVWIDGAAPKAGALPLPWGTIVVNVSGCFAIGLVAAWSTGEGRWADQLLAQRFLMVGVLGGFTTFSSFGLQTFLLFENGQTGAALLNVAASLVLCLGGVALGYALGAQGR